MKFGYPAADKLCSKEADIPSNTEPESDWEAESMNLLSYTRYQDMQKPAGLDDPAGFLIKIIFSVLYKPKALLIFIQQCKEVKQYVLLSLQQLSIDVGA